MVADAPAGDIRVEFTWPSLSWLQSSPDAAMKNTSVKFVTAPVMNVDFGLHNPTTYSNLNPDVILPAYVSGDPNGGGVAAAMGTLVLHGYTDMGTNAPSTLSGAPTVVDFGDIGATYGGVWQRGSKTYLTSAFAKRYVGLKNDPGSVFKVIDPAGIPAVSEYFSLDALGFSTGVIAARGLPADFGPSHDVDMFAQVGTVSLGDLEFDATEENLYVVNLFDKKLYKINIGNPAKAIITAADVTSFNIPDPGCTNGNWRPFALGLDETRNVMLIGGVCDASTGTRTDLRAYVYEFDLTTQTMGAAPVLDFPLDFQRGSVGAGGVVSQHWNPWSDAPADWLLAESSGANRFHPEPLLADIEVEIDGSLILGFRDVWGDRWGTQNYSPDVADFNTYHSFSNGDLYKAKSIGGVYELENNGQFSDGTMGCGVGNGDGPGGGEYYCEDFFGAHSNIPKGGLAYLQGASHFVSVSQDPLSSDSGGTKWMSVVPGSSTQDYQIYKSTIGDGSFYKANGLGDVELLFDSAPIEIGNLVWEDTDSDGVQDAGESGIAGVVVKLFKSDGTTEIGTATTDANGNYIFSNDPNGTSTASHIYQIAMLMADQAYIVRIENATGVGQQGALMTPGLISMSTPNIGEGSNTDINDSDGIASGTDADAAISAANIPLLGANNHTFDFGFSAAPPCPPTRCGTVAGVKN